MPDQDQGTETTHNQPGGNKHIDAPDIHPFQHISSQTNNRKEEKSVLYSSLLFNLFIKIITVDEYSISWIPMNPLNV